MKALYRTAAAVLTLAAAAGIAILANAALRDGSQIRVVNFTLFALGAAIALAVAVFLWSKTLDREGSPGPSRDPRR
jgi:ABC-type sugar transport system permease subunit